MVEIVEGMNSIAPPTEFEKHLKPPFRLSCQALVAAADQALYQAKRTGRNRRIWRSRFRDWENLP